MTVIGGVGHTLPFVIGEFQLAVIAAVLVVVIELGVISWSVTATWTLQRSGALQTGLGIRCACWACLSATPRRGYVTSVSGGEC
jgi:hypothetical protein